ncbi:MAG: hypothetical protein OEM60_01750 [Gammaproteobacteria bacterium]|nr:hypothetical protein [Gammaproteobacteria bacterium]MDH3432558.1 hypothetical protein [Gammaproteobacteria bacterium]
MRRNRAITNGWARFAAVIAAVAISACSTLPPEPEPVEEQPEIVVEPPVAIAEPRPPVKLIKPPQPRQLPPVAIVLTNNQPAYAEVAQELIRHLVDFDIYDLHENGAPPVSILRAINDSDASAVVAIGLRAAQSAVAMSGVPVIFSQVFNHQDHDLLGDSSRGISALAPLDAQIVAWKKMDPAVSRIGAIIGPGHDDLIAEAELAAARHGIELRVQVADSDQQTLYYFKRMVRDIDGYWLFPDNRILSPRVLDQMLAEANRQGVPVGVPNESMLKMGAAISMSTMASDIAAAIVKVLRKLQAGELEQVPPLTPLEEIRVAINGELLSRPAVAQSTTSNSSEEVDR